MNRRLLLLAPLGLGIAAYAGFRTVLTRMQQGRFDPHDVPSPLIGKPLPDFTLPGLDSPTGFTAADIRASLQTTARPMLINFFASWCAPCIIEHPELMALSREGLPIWGIAYKDTPAAAQAFLTQRGNPFQRLAADRPGQVAIDWGVYGVPETYLIDPAGIIRWRMPGPITAEIAANQLRPLLKTLS